MDAGIVVPLAAFAMVIILSLGIPLVRAISRKVELEGASKVPAELMKRLERMEHAIDSIAVEVERISEGQRFTTKLLSDVRQGDARAIPSARSPGEAAQGN